MCIFFILCCSWGCGAVLLVAVQVVKVWSESQRRYWRERVLGIVQSVDKPLLETKYRSFFLSTATASQVGRMRESLGLSDEAASRLTHVFNTQDWLLVRYESGV